jgi:hypothetical protein
MKLEKDLYEVACDAIDSLNAQDPSKITVDGKEWPVELLYSVRMVEEVEEFIPDASDELKIAVRAQHIARWRSPRSDYPQNREGYLKWRSELYGLHAQYAGEELNSYGIDAEFTSAVETIVVNKVKRNSYETQSLEDVACLVFLRHYFEEFIEKHTGEKLQRIILKTWNKMSDAAHEYALKIPFPEHHLKLITEALEA